MLIYLDYVTCGLGDAAFNPLLDTRIAFAFLCIFFFFFYLLVLVDDTY